MKLLSRDFTRAEKLLLLLLVLILLGLGYYQFIDKPIRNEMAIAQADKEALELEYSAIEAKIARLKKMQAELDALNENGVTSVMPSYNNYREELRLLNDILESAESYTITFSNVTRDGDQIRRGFTLQFTAPDFPSVKKMITELNDGPYRCLLGDVRCGKVVRTYRDLDYTTITYSVNAAGTFYETMAGGTADSGLPSDSAAAK